MASSLSFTDDEYPTVRWNLKWDTCHPHACQDLKHPLIGLSAHAYALGEIILDGAFEPQFSNWSAVGILLRVVGGLARVTVTTAKYSDDPAYCESVLDWENARTRVASDYATDLTRFLFAYNAFETVLPILVSRRALKHKTHPELARSLLNRDIHTVGLGHYACSIDSLLCVAQSWEKHAFDEIDDHSQIAASFRAMDLVQVIRNRFVHEAIRFPDRPEAAQLSERGVLRRCTRLTIMTIQMLALAAFKDLLEDQGASIREMHLMPDDNANGGAFDE